jgi:gamma-glutamyl-gamma-aminobutyrate hydrolase PuuD
MRTVENATYPERRDAISHDWSRLFTALGITPILVPNALDDVREYLGLGAKGLLLTGGDNLGAADTPTPRDRTERQLLSGAIERGMAVFGACRGLQMINSYFGGSVEKQLPEPHVGEHAVVFANGETRRVNSFHDEGVMRNGLSPCLDELAGTAAGVVEALRHRDHPIVAVQWHPERSNPSAEIDRIYLQQFLSRCG